jgi:hypothetical protein
MSRPPLAYKNEEFLDGPEGRALRILSEYLEPLSHLRRRKVRDTVVFFGSARIREDGPLAQYYQDARTLARLVTEWAEGYSGRAHRFVVCTGGGPGIMEAANRGASEGKGVTVGLNIGLPFEQFPNPYITSSTISSCGSSGSHTWPSRSWSSRAGSAPWMSYSKFSPSRKPGNCGRRFRS